MALTDLVKDVRRAANSQRTVTQSPGTANSIIDADTNAPTGQHGSIIRNVVNESREREALQPVSWKECKYHKASGERDYCTAFFAWCGKESCRRAKK